LNTTTHVGLVCGMQSTTRLELLDLFTEWMFF